jgi:Flp pilus assembly protein TadG
MSKQMRRGQHGQALVEMGLVILLFIVMVIGIMEFGRAFFIVNMITHAARDGARMAAVIPAGSRGTCQAIDTGSAAWNSIRDQVLAEIHTAVSDSDVVGGGGFTVTPSQSPAVPGAAPCGAPANATVTVTVSTGSQIRYLTSFFGAGFGPSGGISRTATFRDERR